MNNNFSNILRKLIIISVCAFALCSSSEVFARGGSSMDDCTSGSTDPECAIRTVTIAHSHFDIENLVVRTGSTVVISNKDTITHNIQIANEDDDVKDLGLQKPGQEVSTRFSQAGKYRAKCGIIPATNMAITVK